MEFLADSGGSSDDEVAASLPAAVVSLICLSAYVFLCSRALYL